MIDAINLLKFEGWQNSSSNLEFHYSWSVHGKKKKIYIYIYIHTHHPWKIF
jgi:hypothetical protein